MNDPKSYRVPVMRLSDMFKKTTAPSSGDVSSDDPQPKGETAVREEDIQAAVITPSASVKAPTPPVKEPNEPTTPKAPTPSQTAHIYVGAPQKEETPIEPTPNYEKSDTAVTFGEEPEHIKPFSETILGDIPNTTNETPQVDVEKPFILASHSLEKEMLDATTTKSEPASMEKSVSEEDIFDGDDIQDLINESLLSVKPQEQNSPVTKEIPESVVQSGVSNVPDFSQDDVLPTANPLDIWEQASLRQESQQKPRVIEEKISDIVELVATPPTEEPRASPAVEEKTPLLVEEKQLEPVPLTQEVKEEIKPEASIKKPAVEVGGRIGNLDALRKRVRTTGIGTVHREPPKPIHLADTILVKEIDKDRPKPDSKHASIIADVAGRLQNITQDKYGLGAPTQEPSPKAQTTPPTIPLIGEKITEEQTTEIKEESEQVSLKSTAIPLVRTFRADVEQAVMRDRTSIVDMLSAEEKRRNLGETIRMAPHSKASVISKWLLLTSFVLIIGGFFMGGYILFHFFVLDRENTPSTVQPNEILEYDISEQSGKKLLENLTALKENAHANIGAFTEVHFVEGFNDSRGLGSMTVRPSRLFEKLETKVPGALVRTTTETMDFGFHALQENEPFWMLNVNSYDVAFRAMFEWEDTMRYDLSPLFGEAPVPQNTTQTGTTTDQTASTSPEVKPLPTLRFEDITIVNKEARALKDENGKIVLLWAAPDTNSIIITTNKTTLEVLINRLNTRPYQ